MLSASNALGSGLIIGDDFGIAFVVTSVATLEGLPTKGVRMVIARLLVFGVVIVIDATAGHIRNTIADDAHALTEVWHYDTGG